MECGHFRWAGHCSDLADRAPKGPGDSRAKYSTPWHSEYFLILKFGRIHQNLCFFSGLLYGPDWRKQLEMDVVIDILNIGPSARSEVPRSTTATTLSQPACLGAPLAAASVHAGWLLSDIRTRTAGQGWVPKSLERLGKFSLSNDMPRFSPRRHCLPKARGALRRAGRRSHRAQPERRIAGVRDPLRCPSEEAQKTHAGAQNSYCEVTIQPSPKLP